MLTETRSQTVVDLLLQGTYLSMQRIIPIHLKMEELKQLETSLPLQFGVLIGITGDVRGKLILTGNKKVFGAIGQSMFGMPLEGEMLASFSGELGNMIAGGLSTNLVKKGIRTDITAPTIMQGEASLSGHAAAHQLSVAVERVGELETYLLLDY